MAVVIVGVLGAGRAGSACAWALAAAGHGVLLANRRDPSSLTPLIAALPGRTEARSARSAVEDADVVLLTVPWETITQLPPAAAFAGRVVIDATNPLDADGLADLGGRASSFVVRELIGHGRLAKAFNSLPLVALTHEGGAQEDPIVVPLCGDDPEAKDVAGGLIADCGFAPFDLGSLQRGSELQEPGGPLFGQALRQADAERIVQAAARCRLGDWDLL